MVFVELVGNCDQNVQPEWPQGSLPTNVNTHYFDANFTNNPTSYISKYFWEASFDRFKVEGDYVDDIIQIPCTTNNPLQDVLDELDARELGGTLGFCTYSSINEFDHYVIAGTGDFTLKVNYSNDYSVSTAISANCPNPTNITLIDNSPQPGTFCGQAIPCPNCRGESALNYCPSCDDINTQNYYLSELNVAARDAIDKGSPSNGNNYLETVQRLTEILMYNLSNPDASERYVINVSLEKLLEAYANAFMYGQLLEIDNSSAISPDVNSVILVLDKYIQLANNTGDLKQRFYLNLNKAEILRIAGRRDLSLAVLNEISTWVSIEDVEYLNPIICKTNMEIEVLNGTIILSDIEGLIENCDNINNRIATYTGNTQVFEFPTSNSNTTRMVNPNPASDYLEFYSDIKSPMQLKLFNSSGSMVLCKNIKSNQRLSLSILSEGIYFYILSTENGEILLQNKISIN